MCCLTSFWDVWAMMLISSCHRFMIYFFGCLIAYVFYDWATSNHEYFAKRNLPFKTPKLLLGSTAGFFWGKYSRPEFAQMLYNWFPTEKMYGLFDFRQPIVVVRDPELLKQLAVEHFDYFQDHRLFVDFSSEDLFGHSLIALKGQRWRDMRGTLSPVFTGRKMRQMFDMVSDCADNMTKYFVKQSAKGEKNDVEMRDVATRYTSDVIASCAFGIQVNSFEDPNNEFYSTGKIFLGGTGRYVSLTALLLFLIRKLKLNTHLMSLKSTIIDTMEQRKNEGICRPDMINVLMQMHQGKLSEQDGIEKAADAQAENAEFATVAESDVVKKSPQRQWSDKEIISQGFLFFIAGFETVSSLLSFLTYELCINPDVQQKLYEEIGETNESLDGKRINYEALQKMKYLDQVVSECLRKWTAIAMLDRECVKDFECEYGDNAKFRFEKGITFWVPVHALHHDPKYYPDPEKFDPDRFSDENKHNIVSGTYLPFGIGPRNCIGSRFALMEVKAIIFYTLLNFSLVPNAKTQIPIRLQKSPFVLRGEKGLHMELKPREHRM